MSDKQNQSPVVWIVAAVVILYFVSTWKSVEPTPEPKPTPTPSNISPTQILNESYVRDRASKLKILREFSKLPKDNDEARLKFFNDRSEELRRLDFKSYTDLVAEAIAGDGVDTLADKLEAKK